MNHALLNGLALALVLPGVGCTTDDTRTASDAGIDATIDATAATDAATDARGNDSGPCNTCAEAVIDGISTFVCSEERDSGPSSATLLETLNTCICRPENCNTVCKPLCDSLAFPDNACVACLNDKCIAEVNVCLADVPYPGYPAPPDAGAPDGSDDASVDSGGD